MRGVAWVGARDEGLGREELGPLPPALRLVDDPVPEVRFAVLGSGESAALAAMPDLEVVQVRSAGVEWVRPYVPPGAILCNAGSARARPVAEWVLTALLADAKQARAMAEAQTARRWAEEPRYRDLAGRRVLLLGHGAIGRMVGRMLAPFEAVALPVARHPRDGVHAIDELPALLPQADVLVDLLPLTDETRGLVDAAALAALPDGATVVNAGRGATLDTGALVAELQAGRLRAVLDVTDPEPLPPEHPLWLAPNTLISPHRAGDTPGGERAAWRLVGDQLRRWAAGEPLQGVVTGAY